MSQFVSAQDSTELPSLENLKIENVTVRFSTGFHCKLKNLLARQKETLQKKKDELANINSRRVVGQGTKENARKQVTLWTKNVEFTENERKIIPTEIKEGINKALEGKTQGVRGVSLNVLLGDFNSPTSGQVLFVGGADTIAASIIVVDNETNENLASFIATDIDTNLEGGILGLIVRGFDGRGDMINKFSKKIIDSLIREGDVNS
jgi:hypothetical protein